MTELLCASIAARKATARSSARPWRRVGLSLVAVTVAVAVSEGTLRLALRGAFMSPPVFQSAAGVPAYTLAPSKVASVWQFGRLLQVSIDSAGHRVTPGAPVSAPTTLHLVGDSQVFGWGLSDEETLSARLQLHLGTAVRVVNDGVPGYGPDEYRAVLRTIPSNEPVLVVSTEENDGSDAYRLSKPANVACGLISSFERSGAWRCALLDSRLMQEVFVEMNALDHRYHMTPVGFSDYSRVAGRVIQQRISDLLQEDRARRTGRTLYAVVPWKGRYSSSWRQRYTPQPVADLREMPTPFPDSVDTIRRFAKRSDAESLYFETDTHLSPAGADALADIIAAGVKASADISTPKELQ